MLPLCITKTKTMQTLKVQTAIQYTLHVCGLLMEEKELHRKHALHYHRLFNDLVPETDTLMLQTKYSPLQEWLQLQAEFHAARMFAVDQKIAQLETVIDKTKF